MKSWGLMAAPLVVLITVMSWPIGRAVWTSMHLQSGTDGRAPQFIGVDNYAGVLTSPAWWTAVGFLGAWTACVVLAQLVVGVVMAATLHQLTFVAPVLRVVVLVPFAAISLAAATGAIAAVDGGFLAQWAGVDSQAGPLRTFGAIGVAEIWRGSGVVALILLAGFARTSKELALWLSAEGVTAAQRLTKVVLPALVPALVFAAAFRIMDTWRGLGAVWARAMAQSSSDLPQAMVFNTLFDRFEFGLASAMAIVFLLLTLAIGALVAFALHAARTAGQKSRAAPPSRFGLVRLRRDETA